MINWYWYNLTELPVLLRGFWETETRTFNLGNKGLKWGKQGKKGYVGEQGTQEIKILILGNRGTKRFISGEQGNRYLLPTTPERASLFKNLKFEFTFKSYYFVLILIVPTEIKVDETAMTGNRYNQIPHPSQTPYGKGTQNNQDGKK